MKNFFVFYLLLSSTGFAIQAVKLDSIGYGKLLHVDGNVKLPKGQKLNKAAPSKIEIYEKSDGDWTLTEKMSLNDFSEITESISFQKPIHLIGDKSQIKMKASLYHCPKLGHGICVIDDYEGLIKRRFV